MIGTKPTPVYEYSPPAGAFTTDTSVNVTVKINDTDVTDFVTFLHEVCDFVGCGWKAEECEFIVHIKSFDLVIKKTGAQPIDENQSFIFNVTGDNGFSLDVVIHGNGSVTIKSLPSGTYTVTEETSWSWRYTPDSKNQTVNSQSITGGQATVTFNNTRATEQSHESNLNGWKWLNGCAWCDNRWIDKKAHHDSN